MDIKLVIDVARQYYGKKLPRDSKGIITDEYEKDHPKEFAALTVIKVIEVIVMVSFFIFIAFLYEKYVRGLH